MSAIAIIANDGTVADVVMGSTSDIAVLNERFPGTSAVIVPEGATASRGDHYDPAKGFVSPEVKPSRQQVDF